MNKFESNIINMYGGPGRAWLEMLPDMVKKTADKYNLSELTPVNHLSYNYVLSGFQANLPIILKLGFDTHGLKQEVSALKAFEGFGTVKVLIQEEKMVLLERAVPGHSLKSYFPAKDKEAILIACEVMQRLHQAPLSKCSFQNFQDIKDWLTALDRDVNIPPLYLEKARESRDRLLATASRSVLLHGDLHHDNILENAGKWVVIDPKGVIGEPAYEVASFIRNPIPELLNLDHATRIIKKRITTFASILELTPSRILKWSFVQAVLSWIWALEDGYDETYFKKLTEVFALLEDSSKTRGIKTKPIKVVPYNPDWPKLFETEAEKIKEALGDNSLAIHHIGSTFVPNLVAKPKIDIIAVVKEPEKAISDLETIGFTYKGEWNIPFKYGFTKRGELEVNLHVYETGHPEIELNLLFRDYLRSHPKACDEYAALKENLLKDESSFEKSSALFSGYNLGKDAFIRKILKKAGFNQVRVLKCVHHAEWDAAKHFRQTYFFDKVPIIDPYTWTFNHADHAHFVLYQGVDIIGYAHVELWPAQRAALRIIVIELSKRNQGLGTKFLGWIERWLKLKGYHYFHTESSPTALAFYEHHGYTPMPFDDPNGNKTDPRDTPMGKLLD